MKSFNEKLWHVLTEPIAQFISRRIQFGQCDISRSIDLDGANPENQYDITVPFYILGHGFKIRYKEVDAWLLD